MLEFRQHFPSRIVFLVAIALATGSLQLATSGCGDDSSTAPVLLPDLAAADSAIVTLHVLGVVYYGSVDVYDVIWKNFGTSLTACSYDDSSASLDGDQTVTTEHSYSRDLVSLHFDPRTAEIDSLYCSNHYSSPGGGRSSSVTAHAIPLSSYEMVDGRMEAIWRIDGVMTCAVLDTVTYSSSGGHASLATWSCAGEEEAYLEIKVTN